MTILKQNLLPFIRCYLRIATRFYRKQNQKTTLLLFIEYQFQHRL